MIPEIRIEDYNYSLPDERIAKYPLREMGKSVVSGTTVTFMPDDRIFESIHFNPDTIKEHLEEVAFLNRGLEINFIVEAKKEIQILEMDELYTYIKKIK